MTTAEATSPVKKDRSRGRGLLWAGVGLCLLGIAIGVVQFSLRQFVVPWYMPILATIGALLLVGAVARRRSIPRIVALVLVAALAGFQWYFLVSVSKLPAYSGPAQVGQKLPAFRTTLADGRAFTQRDLQNGGFSVLVFFRGRW